MLAPRLTSLATWSCAEMRPGATLERLTPEAVVETSYRDATVVTDRRYVYVVQAVDGAEPPNLSPPSSEATEQAR